MRNLRENDMEERIETEDLILSKGKYDDWKDIFENLWRHEESAKYMLWTTVKTEEKAKERKGRRKEETYICK